MGILSTIDRQIRAETIMQDGSWRSHPLFDGYESESGIRVNERTGIRNPTVWACVRWRGHQFAMLPKKVNENVEMQGRMTLRPAPKHPLYRIISSTPNPTIDTFGYFALLSADLDLWGNHYSVIERGSSTGRLRALWRIRPDMVRIEQDDDGSLTYCVQDDKGGEQRFSSARILHIRGLGFDGIRGYSPIRMMMNTIGWSEAAQRYGNSFFKNASRPSGIISTDMPVKKEVKPEIIEALRASREKVGSLILIEGATKYHPLSMPNDEAQFLETLQYQEEKICGIMETPQHKVQILRRSTNNNIEHQAIEAVTDCLQPLCVRVEKAFEHQLLSDEPSSGLGGGTERDRYSMQCELKGLLRGDTAAQTAHLQAMFDRGIYSGNDCADYLGNAPFEGGDQRFINRAYGPLDMAAEWSKVSQNNPSPAEPDPGKGETEKKAQAFFPLFRDCVGRTINRRDREKAADAIFRPILCSMAQALDATVGDSFLDRYLAAIGKRAAGWDEGKADEITSTEFERAVNELGGTHAQEKD
jgi:HK97 family phage portal protein